MAPARLCGLLALFLLAGCGPTVRFVDESGLRMDPRMAGRWVAVAPKKEERMEVQIAGGSGCGLLQIMAETETYRLCVVASAGDYAVLASTELDTDPQPGAANLYNLTLAHWMGPDEIGSVSGKSNEVLAALGWPAQPEQGESCRAKPESERDACTVYVVDLAALPRVDAAALERAYRAEIKDDDDEAIFKRLQPRSAKP